MAQRTKRMSNFGMQSKLSPIHFSKGALAGSYQWESVDDINLVDGLNAYSQHVRESESEVLRALIEVESLCP